jgi:hypothetical protein
LADKKEIMKSVKDSDKPFFEKYFAIVEKYNSPVGADNDPSKPDNFGGVKIETFAPSTNDVANINNNSVVTILSFAESKIIIPGDSEPSALLDLLGQPAFVNSIKNADILIAPHHGRDSGFCPELFEHFKPLLTIISDGRYTDTSATGKYCNVTNGFTVNYRKGESEKRQCVTTRNDGYIVVDFFYNSEKKPKISVTAKGK